MWTFLLDPVFQGLAFVLTLCALGYVIYDLYDDVRDPMPRDDFKGRRRASKPAESAPRKPTYVEPSLEIWTDSSGETRGRVKRGPQRGKRIEDMTREECDEQIAYARGNDPPSAVALETYVRHRFGQQRRYDARPAAGGLSRAQAFAELGLSEGASEADIHAAYRVLIKKHHPDHGGSHAKAAKINQAKDFLVG